MFARFTVIANTCDIMRREGLTAMDYMEQLSWLFCLKLFEEIKAIIGAVLERAFWGKAVG